MRRRQPAQPRRPSRADRIEITWQLPRRNVEALQLEIRRLARRHRVDIQSIRIEENRFGFEPEVTAKVAKLGCRIYEVGISYYGRTYAEGKKISYRDGFRAIYCILKYNLFR